MISRYCAKRSSGLSEAIEQRRVCSIRRISHSRKGKEDRRNRSEADKYTCWTMSKLKYHKAIGISWSLEVSRIDLIMDGCNLSSLTSYML